ncbi:hypothetical protein Lesp02_17540 [Lentzea sp. NBRC 105346]|uniref:protein NO VEIN domain-containing protein n=1 Tax=Lentzea sp. NBRC 105346 TaxID=3032205 RepID=UPI0024A4EC37|nr:DUF3883 domain-containing protein [Lentzea sp. NBRC 105346]GLZ29564.1 hypothetical protein Lesp02_17540 [Lentzea sp. NBRC 105346]
MHAFDGGRELLAQYTVVADGGQLALIMESFSGIHGSRPATNPDYRKALTVLLTRLRDRNAVITEGFVDSDHAINKLKLTSAQRALLTEPLRLVDHGDMDRLRKQIGERAGRVGQQPGAPKASNATKKIRLRLEVPGYGPQDAKRLEDDLAGRADLGLAEALRRRDPAAVADRLRPIVGPEASRLGLGVLEITAHADEVHVRPDARYSLAYLVRSQVALEVRQDGAAIRSWTYAGDLVDADLLRDLTDAMVFLADLCGDERSDVDSPLESSLSREVAESRRRVPPDPVVNRAIEVRAEDVAAEKLEKLGYQVERVGALKLGYDLDCVHTELKDLHVEVKGTRTAREHVTLTRQEVDHPETCEAEHALFVVSRIEVDYVNKSATGGDLREYRPWQAEEEHLTPTEYRYQLP